MKPSLENEGFSIPQKCTAICMYVMYIRTPAHQNRIPKIFPETKSSEIWCKNTFPALFLL